MLAKDNTDEQSHQSFYIRNDNIDQCLSIQLPRNTSHNIGSFENGQVRVHCDDNPINLWIGKCGDLISADSKHNAQVRYRRSIDRVNLVIDRTLRVRHTSSTVSRHIGGLGAHNSADTVCSSVYVDLTEGKLVVWFELKVKFF